MGRHVLGLLVLGFWTYAQTYRLMVMSHMIVPTGAWATPALQRLKEAH